MTYCDILREIHKAHRERDVFSYLSRWVEQDNDRLLMENCKLRSSLDLIQKFNDQKWNNELLGNILRTRC